MFGLHAQVSDHEVRLAALESHTVSGVPDMTIARRFTSLHERVDAVGNNLLAKIDEFRDQMQKFQLSTIENLGQINRDISRIELRIDKVYLRLDQQEGHMMRLESTMKERFSKVDEKISRIDERFTQVDERFAQVDERFVQVDERFTRVDDQLGEIKSMLLSLGASAPADRVN